MVAERAKRGSGPGEGETGKREGREKEKGK